MVNKLQQENKLILKKIILFELYFFIICVLIFFLTKLFSSNSIVLKYEKLLYLLILIPIFYSLVLLKKNKKDILLNKLANPNIIQNLFNTTDYKNYLIKIILIRNVIFFLIIAICQPIFGKKEIKQNEKKLELVLALDISNSMNVKDINPYISRLEIIKRAMIQLINSLNGEKIGICIFAGNAYVQLPITNDYGAAKMFVNEIETDLISNQGTNLEKALNTSSNMFSNEKTNKAILLVTDGENHEGSIDNVINEIKINNILIATLGIGTKKGGPIFNDVKKPYLGYKLDENGKQIISKLNPNLIRFISKKSNGIFEITESEYPELENLIGKLKQASKTQNSTISIKVKDNWYQIALSFAMISLIIYLFYPFKIKN